MKEFSKETIEIDGKEYTLFLNRKGIVAFEKYARKEKKEIDELKNKVEKIDENKIFEVDDNTNPFEDDDINDVEKISEDAINVNKKIFIKLYWIMFYEEQQLTISEVTSLYEKACNEYGEESVNALAEQMLEDANKNANELVSQDKQLKNLTALRPKN